MPCFLTNDCSSLHQSFKGVTKKIDSNIATFVILIFNNGLTKFEKNLLNIIVNENETVDVSSSTLYRPTKKLTQRHWMNL